MVQKKSMKMAAVEPGGLVTTIGDVGVSVYRHDLVGFPVPVYIQYKLEPRDAEMNEHSCTC